MPLPIAAEDNSSVVKRVGKVFDPSKKSNLMELQKEIEVKRAEEVEMGELGKIGTIKRKMSHLLSPVAMERVS